MPGKKIRVLELFKGTGSIGKHCAKHPGKYEVVSLDFDKRYNADITVDILEWRYQAAFPRGHFDIIWGSPPCTEFSCLLETNRVRFGRERDLVLADAIVQKTLEIIRYFQPKVWFIENPQTGLLKSRPYMQDLQYDDVCYCQYSSYPYMKRTRIWSNLDGAFTGKMCPGAGRCPGMEGKRHKLWIGAGCKERPIDRKQVLSIPPALVADLFAAADVRLARPGLVKRWLMWLAGWPA